MKCEGSRIRAMLLPSFLVLLCTVSMHRHRHRSAWQVGLMIQPLEASRSTVLQIPSIPPTLPGHRKASPSLSFGMLQGSRTCMFQRGAVLLSRCATSRSTRRATALWGAKDPQAFTAFWEAGTPQAAAALWGAASTTGQRALWGAFTDSGSTPVWSKKVKDPTDK